MRVCEKSGAEAITVHMRLREERPAEPAHWDEMERLWDAVQAGDQGVATWEEMNRIEMGISWDIWYLLISNISEPGNWDGDNFICIEKGILRTGEYAFLFVRLRLTLPPPGPRVGQRRLLQQTSNRWVLEALQGEGLPALRGDDRKRPALWLFSQIFPALVFVQD